MKPPSNPRKNSLENKLPDDVMRICSEFLLAHPTITIRTADKDPFLNVHASGPHTDLIRAHSEQGDAVLVKVWRISRHSSKKKRLEIFKSMCAALKQWKEASCSHPGIVPFIGLAAGLDEQMPSLVLPQYANGNAFEYLRKRAPSPHVLEVYSIIHDISDALKFLHNQSPPIVHGALYGKNILISDSGRPLLTDIGVSELAHQHGECQTEELHRARWMPPDIIDPTIAEKDADLADSSLPRPSSDVYSFAMTTLELLTLRVPFAHIKRSFQVILVISKGQRPRYKDCPEVEPEMWALLRNCWEHLPSQRPTMGEVCSQLARIISRKRQHRQTSR